MSKGVLVDMTKCYGCGACIVACKLWNEQKYDEINKPTLGEKAQLMDINWTVVGKHTVIDRDDHQAWRFAKMQCLHCVDPACVSSCLVKALRKSPQGPVVYHPDLCVGCRYCMVACPFNIIKYEWDKSFPKITKCQMCSSRVDAGEMPACIAVCPNQVMTYGDRDQLITEAHQRIAANGQLYVDHIFGEHEVGGTVWMYLSDQPFEKLGFKTSVPNESLPALTWQILNKLPMILVAWTTILSGIYFFNKRRHALATEKEESQGGPRS
jgi:formate dehydrogenase iron-sulfur subunit